MRSATPKRSTPGRNDLCPCGSGRKFKRCCIDGDTADGEDAVSTHVAGGEITLIVETAGGPLIRHVPDASPLATDVRVGQAAEDAIQDSAALWGLPDFVFRPAIKQLASGVREIGDGTVVVGKIGLAIQSKAREGDPGDAEKELKWLAKNAKAGLSQAAGTIRTLTREPTELENARGRKARIDGGALDWTAVVVIDHPASPEGFTPDLSDAKVPAVVLLRRDWEFLFQQLKSSRAVAQYLLRVAGKSVPLGGEPARYFEYAAADEAAEPEVLGARFEIAGGEHQSSPLLPMEVQGSAREPAQLVFRALLEDIATAGGSDGPEEDRLRMLAELDRFPVAQRGQIGEFLLKGLREAKGVRPPEVLWRIRRAGAGHGGAHLGFGVCSAVHTPALQTAWRSWVELRHYERLQQTGEGALLSTVGVLLTPGTAGKAVDTTAIAVGGNLELRAEELRDYRALWSGDASQVGRPGSL